MRGGVGGRWQLLVESIQSDKKDESDPVAFDESNFTIAKSESEGFGCVLGKFPLLCSQVFTSMFCSVISGRWFFLWSRCCSLSRLVMNKCVAGEVCSRSLLSASLSCCLLPHCSCQAFTTIISPPPIRQPFKLRVVSGWWRVVGSSFNNDQPAVAAHRRSCSVQRVLILCFWLGCWWRCFEEDRVRGCSWLESHNQSRGLKGCCGVLLESQPILISNTGLRVAHKC